MKRFNCIFFLLLPALAIVAPADKASAQITEQIGNGTDTSTISLYVPATRANATSSLHYSRGNTIYLASELSAASIPAGALITKVAFNKGYHGTLSPATLEIWMRNSTTNPPLSSATTWSSITTTHTQVYNNTSQMFPIGAGWVEFTLSTPFVWTGNNLEIATHFWTGGVNTSGGIRWENQGTTSADLIIGALDDVPPPVLDGSASNYKRRPNIRLTYTSDVCTAPPVAGTAVAVSETCPNADFNLALSGNTSGTGQTVQWQTSTNNTTWTNIAGANSAVSVVNQTADRYYRAVVTCSNQSDTSASVFVTTVQPLSGAYTIDAGTATGGTNFQTFEDLATRLNCAGVSGPVTVTVQPGSYNGRLVLNSIPGVSSTNTVTINGNSQALNYSTSQSNERSAILLNGAKWVTIENLTINVNSGTFGWGVHLTNGADNNTLTNNTINSDITGPPSGDFAGIVASGSMTSVAEEGNNANNTTITGNTIRGGLHGIILIGNDTAGLINGNVIANNVIEDMGQTGIYLQDSDGADVNGNDISRPNRTDMNFFRGVYLTGTSSNNNQIRNNQIHDTNNGNLAYTGAVYGIYIGNADAPVGQENKVFNNIIYHVNGEGPQYGIWSTGSDGNFNYHNTVVFDDAASTSTSDTRALYQSTTANNVQFWNNIAYVDRGGTGDQYALYYGTNTSVIISDNNVLFVSTAGNHYVGRWGTINHTTLAGWQSVAGGIFDQNSVFADPIFTNASTGNLTPTNSVVENTGAALGITADINGTPRSMTTPDAGAFEWSTVDNDAAITSFVQPSSYPFCGTSVPVVFVLTNAGSTTLNSVTVNWSVNGTAQTPQNLTSLNLAPGASINVTLGNATVVTNVLYDFSATTTNPNGTTDGNTTNDTYTHTAWRTSLSGIYTVDQNAPVSATNYQSLQSVADDLKNLGICGPVMVNVVAGSGPYTEQLLIESIPGTIASQPVMFNGNGNTIQTTPTSTDKYVVQLKGVNYLAFENFTVTSLSNVYGWGISIVDGSSKVRIRNNVVNVSLTETSATNAMGITTSGTANYLNGTAPSDSLDISGNTINGGGVGIQMVGNFAVQDRNTNILIEDNIVRDFYTEGIQVLGAINILVRGNDISRPNRTNSGTFYGIYFWNATENYLIDKNRIHDISNPSMTAGISGGGMYIIGNSTYSSSGVVSNNLIYNFNNSGNQYGIQDQTAGPATISIVHNTIALNDSAYAGSSNTSALYVSQSQQSAMQHNIRNNIFFISRGGTGTKRLIDISDSDNGPFVFPDDNVFWFGTASGNLQVGRIGGTTYATLDEWQATGRDTGSVYANPQFTNPTAGDFKPQNPDINGAAMGTSDAGVTTDILGFTRGTNPDPGAYEFFECVPPLAPEIISGDNVVCENETGVTYSVTAVSGATNYIWTVPAGAVVSSGQGTTSVTVDYATSSGEISLVVEDTCGMSQPVTLDVTVEICGSIEEQSSGVINVYPNPFNETTTIEFRHNHQAVLMTLTDASGRVIRKHVFSGDEFLLQRDGLIPGFYILEMKSESAIIGRVRLVIQ